MPPVLLSYAREYTLSTLGSFLWIAVFVGLSWLTGSIYKKRRESRPSIHALLLDASWLQRPTPGEIWRARDHNLGEVRQDEDSRVNVAKPD